MLDNNTTDDEDSDDDETPRLDNFFSDSDDESDSDENHHLQTLQLDAGIGDQQKYQQQVDQEAMDEEAQPISIEEREVDIRERESFDEFFRKGCCGNKCYEQFDDDYIRRVRWDMEELTKEHLDLVVMGQLMACTNLSANTSTNKKTSRERKQQQSCYYHGMVKVKINCTTK